MGRRLGKRMKRLSEKQVIDLISKTLSIRRRAMLWNDDVNAVKFGGQNLVFKCDMFVRGTDAPKQMSLGQMARKSIVSCVSDFACKGVKPLASLISLGIPRNFGVKDITELAKGFAIAEKEFHVNIIGGDTNESKDLIIDCCIIGISSVLINRSGANLGDLIITSGPFGYSSAALRILQGRARAESHFSNKAKRAILMPKAKLGFGLGLVNYASSTMDSSDGLAITLHEMSEQSKKKFIIESLPTTKEVRKFVKANGSDICKLVFQGGEEYEIIATVPRRNLNKVLKLAREKKCRLFVIGRVEAGKGVFMNGNKGQKRIEKVGWEHLR